MFERRLLPGIADAVGGGRVRLDAIARWLADVAYNDLLDAGVAEAGVWILRRSVIRVERFPCFGEEVDLRTWCSGLGRFSAERRTSIAGVRAAVEAVALWVRLDAQTLRPLRLPDEFVEVYRESAAGRDAKVRLRHPDPPVDAERSTWRFRATDLDVAGHINNAAYLAPLEEELRGSEPSAIGVEVEYREPARPGELELLRHGDRRWLVLPGGDACASLLVGAQPVLASD